MPTAATTEVGNRGGWRTATARSSRAVASGETQKQKKQESTLRDGQRPPLTAAPERDLVVRPPVRRDLEFLPDT